MIQTCNAAYWEGLGEILRRNGDPENPGQPCGRVFDDAERLTICPHEPLGSVGLPLRPDVTPRENRPNATPVENRPEETL